MDKKRANYSHYDEPPIIGNRCKLILKDGTIIQTSRVVAIYGSTIETVHTIYEKEIKLNLHQLTYEEKLSRARQLNIIQ